jgi:hypothetical protein
MRTKVKRWKEKPLKEKIITILEERGAVVVPINNGGVFNPVTGKFFMHRNKRQKGVSDLLACYKGLFIAIEVKGMYNKPSLDQAVFIQRVLDAGGDAIWTNNPEKVLELIAKLDSERKSYDQE